MRVEAGGRLAGLRSSDREQSRGSGLGSVLIEKADYNGAQLVPDGSAVWQIEFTAAGRHTLKLVFVFSPDTSARGELREDCGGGSSQLLREVDASEPL